MVKQMNMRWMLFGFVLFVPIMQMAAAVWLSEEGLVDGLIFTKDRPLFLRDGLRAMRRHVTGLRSLSAICLATNDRFVRAYEAVAAEFPEVQIVMQRRANPRADFVRLLNHLAEQWRAPYSMFSVDDLFVIAPISLFSAVAALQATNAYGFFLRLGKEITYCYMARQPSPPPPLTQVGLTIYAWEFKAGTGDWNYPHSVDMTIYPREQVLKFLRSHTNFSSPNTFEGAWASSFVPSRAQGLCYARSPIINCVVNMVQTDWTANRCGHLYSAEQLLRLFEEGYAIDTDALARLERNAPHVEVELPLIRVAVD